MRDFLRKLHREEKIELVEPSTAIANSYSQKATNYLSAGKILYDAVLYENTIAELYYAMYNSLLSLLFTCGIKSENHAGSIVLLQTFFDMDTSQISFAKQERIDKQYYVADSSDIKESALNMISIAEDFINGVEGYKLRLLKKDIQDIRNSFNQFFD